MIHVGAVQIRFLVTGAQSNGSAAFFELTVPAGVKLPAPAHSHDAYEETLYGLEGITTWTVDGVPIEVGPGQTLCIPRGAVHTFAIHGDVDAKSLSVLSPAVTGIPGCQSHHSRITASRWFSFIVAWQDELPPPC